MSTFTLFFGPTRILLYINKDQLRRCNAFTYNEIHKLNSGVYTGWGVRTPPSPRGRPYLYLSNLKLSKQQKWKMHLGVEKINNSPVKLDQFSINKNINRYRSEFCYTCLIRLPIEHTISPRQNLLRLSHNLGKKVRFFSFLPISLQLKLIPKNCSDKNYSLLNFL